MTPQEHTRLRKRLEESERRAAEQEGAAAQLRKRFREYNCQGASEAEGKLADLRARLVQTENELQQGLRGYDEKWGRRHEE